MRHTRSKIQHQGYWLCRCFTLQNLYRINRCLCSHTAHKASVSILSETVVCSYAILYSQLLGSPPAFPPYLHCFQMHTSHWLLMSAFGYCQPDFLRRKSFCVRDFEFVCISILSAYSMSGIWWVLKKNLLQGWIFKSVCSKW